jgi:hypothetical protein
MLPQLPVLAKAKMRGGSFVSQAFHSLSGHGRLRTMSGFAFSQQTV